MLKIKIFLIKLINKIIESIPDSDRLLEIKEEDEKCYYQIKIKQLENELYYKNKYISYLEKLVD